MACPWLILRFIDPHAEFLYAPTSEVRERAESSNATPFDILDTRFSHRGERCSFDAFVDDFELEDIPALDEIARIVRGADTARFDLAPESAGLLAMSLGLSRLFERDDDVLSHGLVLYDALFAWASEARTETHNWEAFRPQSPERNRT